MCGCSVKYDVVSPSSSRVISLEKELLSLSPHVSKKEAKDLSVFALRYTKILANRYHIAISPRFQNFLINIGLKKRGYCYNYANDLAKALLKRDYKSFDFYRIIYRKGTAFEHNALLVRAKDSNSSGVVLDGWRNAGRLYFSKIENDKKYKWRIFYQLK